MDCSKIQLCTFYLNLVGTLYRPFRYLRSSRLPRPPLSGLFFVFFLIFSFAFLVAFRLSSKRQQGKKKRKATLLLKSLITELTQLIGWASRDRQVAAGTRTALGDWRRWFFRCGGVHGGGIFRWWSRAKCKKKEKEEEKPEKRKAPPLLIIYKKRKKEE